MKIMFYIGYAETKWNKHVWEQKGIGGSEYCVIKLSEQLAKHGHEVYVVGDVEGAWINRVTYINVNNLLNRGNERGSNSIAFTDFDWVIGVNYINFTKVLDKNSIFFKKALFWAHNEYWHTWHEGKELEDKGKSILEDERLKAIICVSKWQVEHINLKRAEALGYIPSNDPTYIQVISNAIDPNDWENIDVPKVRNSFIYSSATDRGLDWLLNMWDRIYYAMPESTLNICTPPYSEKWGYEPPQLPGVTWLGALPPKKLYEQISKSEYWLYPSKYPETYCITALEMMLGGVKICSTNTGNLDALLNGRGAIFDSGQMIGDIQNDMVNAVMMDNGACHDDKAYHYKWYKQTMENKKWVMKQTWENRVHEWIMILENM
jgi:glycosyltransferase involved in cell wall biosynthesis